MQTDILRDKFLNFFKSKKHKIVASDTLVPKDDPTVLFTPAGMNQFKKQFLGQITDFTRAASSQRCLRTDDLDKVGKTTGHHTLFEMLGNFSFGDYFKKEAIIWAWEFLTQELKIRKESLRVSVYEKDDEAYKIWSDVIGIKPEWIYKLGDKDNFWPADAVKNGPNGPCGPCSEIFYDFGPDKGCREDICDPTCPCGRFVEIWNLVFTQFNRKDGGLLEPLPQKNIDTGMGLERLAAVMQGAANNFETDLFLPLLKEIRYNIKKKIPNENELVYAIADHIRAITFSIYDGVLPSNEGRGYVVRKVIRKSVLHLRSLGIEKPFLYKLVPILSGIMKRPYPELTARRENISEIILTEEKNFISTLNSSDILLKSKLENFSKNQNPDEVGAIVFQLYDTFGIPLELTEDWLNKNNIIFSKKAFNDAMEEQKKRSKTSSTMKGDVFAVKELKLDVKDTSFVGYKQEECKAKVLKIIKEGKEIKKAVKGEDVKIILDKTPFYAESGGQIGDTGEISKGKNIITILDTQKNNKVFIHVGRVKEGCVKVNDEINAKINSARRLAIARNHTATHLLQAALRIVLGDHVQQQGSLVEDSRLRFDFTHFKALTQEEILRVEELVNDYILENHALASEEMALALAKKTGALALFSEKYEGKVRVVSVSGMSKEFCGGTHLNSTGLIGLFRIEHEGSVASGVRRIEAVTGKAAYKVTKSEELIINEVREILNTSSENVAVELEKKISRIKELEKQLGSQKFDSVRSQVDDLVSTPEVINNINVIVKLIPDSDMGVLRSSMDIIKQKCKTADIALGSNKNSQAQLVVGITADLTDKFDAGSIVKDIAGLIGGSGGGRKDFAQAGGNQPEKLEAAFAKLKEMVKGTS